MENTNPQPAEEGDRGGERMERMEGTAEELTARASAQNPVTIPNQPKNLPVVPEYIQAEAFLENIGFFTPSSKRIKGIYTKEKVIGEKVYPDGTIRKIKTQVRASAGLWLPITSDQDYYRAFLKICDEVADHDGRFRIPLAVPILRLAKLAGKPWSKKTHTEIREWFERMTGTLIKGGLYRAKRKDYDEGIVGTVFSQVVLRGQQMKNGKNAETNYVWPSPWFLSNYFYHHLRPIDFNFYRRLRKPIAKALCSLLETGWFASGGKPYPKRYHDLCQEFLLTEHLHPSLIQQQLDPAHRELEREYFLARWEYRRAANKIDYIVTYWPGEKFFTDQKARIDRRQLAEWISSKTLSAPTEAESQSNGDAGDPVATSRVGDPEHEALAQLLTNDILTVLKDQGSRQFYLKVARTLPEQDIRRILSEIKADILHNPASKVRNPAAVFTTRIKDSAREQGIAL